MIREIAQWTQSRTGPGPGRMPTGVCIWVCGQITIYIVHRPLNQDYLLINIYILGVRNSGMNDSFANMQMTPPLPPLLISTSTSTTNTSRASNLWRNNETRGSITRSKVYDRLGRWSQRGRWRTMGLCVARPCALGRTNWHNYGG